MTKEKQTKNNDNKNNNNKKWYLKILCFSISVFDEIVFNFQFVFKTVLKWNKANIYGKKETFYKIV